MRILYVSQYFPPEIGATQTRAFEMARGLVRAGHRVTVLTEFPNHPKGVIPPRYRGRYLERAELDGIDVIRVWVKASPHKTVGNRLLFYGSFFVNALVGGIFAARGKYDLIFATSPPLYAGAAGMILSLARRTPFVFEVRDLWPESAVQLGELSHGFALSVSKRLEKACYRRAAHIVAVTQGIRNHLLERGHRSDRVTMIPNGVNTELYGAATKDPALKRRLGLAPEQFVVIYAGLHGLAHGLETAIDAAALLREKSEVVFLFVGDGPCKQALVQRAREQQLPNVVFRDAVPEEELPAYLAIADVGLDTRRRLEISRGTRPVKMLSYMACERAVLLSIEEGEATELLHSAGAGLSVPPEDPRALADAIVKLRDSPRLRAEYGRRGRAFVQANLTREGQARELESLLVGVHRAHR